MTGRIGPGRARLHPLLRGRLPLGLVPRLLLGLLILAAPPAPLQGQQFPADEDLALMLRYIVEDEGVPGVVLGVLEPDGSTRVVYWGSGGEGARPLGPRSVFEIGSITKTFAATVLADMVSRGEVALEDPVARYLPEEVAVPSRGGHRITLEHLATHTSGLPMWGRTPDPADPRRPFDDLTVEGMYTFLGDLELEQDPGSGYRYSNLGYSLLGHALARAAGTRWPELVRQRVLDPLGMDMTGHRVEGERRAWMTRPHKPGDVVEGTAHELGAAGGLHSNAEDLLRYLGANVGPPETALERAMRMAHRVRIPWGEQDSRAGLAWQTRGTGERSVVWHGGRRAGYMGWIGFEPERQIGTVVLTNTEAFTDSGLALALLMMSPPPDSWEAAAVDASTLRDYVGEYRGSSGGSFYVRLEDEGWLTYQPSRNARTRLYPRSDSSFYMLRGPWTFTFRRDEGGQVAGMYMVADARDPAAQGMERAVARVGDETPAPEAVARGYVSSTAFPWRLGLGIAGGVVGLLALVALVGYARSRLT